MRHVHWKSAPLVATLSVLLAACPGDDPGTDDGTADDATVTISGSIFQPDTISVETGTRVTFVNEDMVQHTVTAGTPGDESGEFHEVLSGQDERAEVTLDDAGTYPYFCRVHPGMTATIEVGSG
jgi:plastocyanin